MDLDYERSRAGNPRQAVMNFLKQLPAELQRTRDCGVHLYQRLLRLELACAEHGLAYPTEVTSGAPPWRLPTYFIGLSPTELPPHPLIDRTLLANFMAVAGHHNEDAVSALQWLVSGSLQNDIWRGLDRISSPADARSQQAHIAVCLHLFYPEMWPELNQALNAIPEPFDLFVTMPDYACTPILYKIAEDKPGVRFFARPNRGRDVLPFVNLLKLGYFDGYDAVCKLHSKRSPHMENGQNWREQLIASLLGDRGQVRQMIKRFRDNSNLGLIGPAEFLVEPGSALHSTKNRMWMENVAMRANLQAEALQRPFFSGTMFWFRSEALDRLRHPTIADDEFPYEMAQTDGTPAHALERMILPLVEAAGFQVARHSSLEPRFL